MVSRWSPKPEAGVRFSSPLPNNIPSDDEWGISALITLRRKTELVRFQPLGPNADVV